jgi:hypothetical protein
MKDRIVRAVLAGLVVGIVIAEFFPDLFKNSMGQFAESFSSPFDGHRNHLALHFGAIGAVIGALAGWLFEQGRGTKR